MKICFRILLQYYLFTMLAVFRCRHRNIFYFFVIGLVLSKKSCIGVIAGLQEVLQHEQVLTESTTVIGASVDHVASAVQNTQQQLATQQQQM